MANELKVYIDAQNWELQQIAEIQGGTVVGMLTNDVEHWAGYGIHTPAEFERYLLEMELYDYFKTVHGVRPRHFYFKTMSDADIQRELDLLDGKDEKFDIECERQAEELGVSVETLLRWREAA